MKLTEKLLDLIESLKYKKEDNSHGYDLTAKSPYGEVLIRVHLSDYGSVVFAVEVGDKRLFDAEGDNDTIVESEAKSMVDRYIASRKFNPEKWLKSSKYVEKFLNDIDSGKNKIMDRMAVSSDNLAQSLLAKLFDEVSYYGGYVSNEVPPFADDLLLSFLKSSDATKIMLSKVRRLIEKGDGKFKKRWRNGNFSGSQTGMSLTDLTDKAINKIISKSGSNLEDDFWKEMMGNQSIRQKLLKLKGR